MNFQGSRRRGEDGIAMVIDFLLSNARLVLGIGGAAMLGIATLAVKRLIERAGRAADDEKVEQKMAESWEELSLVSASPEMIRKGIEGVVMKHVAKAARQQKDDLNQQPQMSKPESKSKRLQLCVLTLQERLQQYYHARAALTPHEVQRAQSLALDICTEIQGFLHSRHPDMPLGEMSLGGSLLDDLQVVTADHACLLVPLQLEASLWRLIPGEETLLTHPLHWMVRRVNLEYFPRGRSYWDRHLVGGYLSAEADLSDLASASPSDFSFLSEWSGSMDEVPGLSHLAMCSWSDIPVVRFEVHAFRSSYTDQNRKLIQELSYLSTTRFWDLQKSVLRFTASCNYRSDRQYLSLRQRRATKTVIMPLFEQTDFRCQCCKFTLLVFATQGLRPSKEPQDKCDGL